MLTNQDIQALLRRKILASISEKGLLPRDQRGDTPCLLSYDAKSDEYKMFGMMVCSPVPERGFNPVALNEFNVQEAAGDTLAEKLSPLVEGRCQGTSVMDILLERAYAIQKLFVKKEADVTLLQHEWARRLTESIVLIYKPQSKNVRDGVQIAARHLNPARTPANEAFHRVLKGNMQDPVICATYTSMFANPSTMPEAMKSYFYGEKVFDEYQTDLGVSPRDLMAVLIPLNLKGKVDDLFPGVPMFIAPPYRPNLDISDIELENYFDKQYCAQIIGKTKMTVSLLAPNYTQALTTFIQSTGIQHFAVHAVRLPTVLDVQQKQNAHLRAGIVAEEKATNETKMLEERAMRIQMQVAQEGYDRLQRMEKFFDTCVAEAAQKAVEKTEAKRIAAVKIQGHVRGRLRGKPVRFLYQAYQAKKKSAKPALVLALEQNKIDDAHAITSELRDMRDTLLSM